MKMRLPNLVPAARAAAAALLLALLAGCLQDSPEKLMASAREHLAKGDRSTAVIQLRNVLKEKPDNGEARLLLGQTLLEADDFAGAEKELGRALELNQPHEKVLPLFVLALSAQGKSQAVVAEVQKYKLFDPAAVAATRVALGDAYLQLRNEERAREAYAVALAAVPGYPGALLGQARLSALEGKLDEALRQTDEVIAADPKLGEARAFRANLLLVKGDRPGAKKSLEEAVAADGRYVPARLALVELLTDDREYEAAAALVEGTRKIAPSDLRVTYLGANLAFRRGDTEQARAQVQQMLKHLPDHVPSLVLSGAIDIRARQFAAAEGSLRKALARAPEDVLARQLLAFAYLRMGQPEKAKDALRPLIERGPISDPAMLVLAGEAYLASGDVAKALAFYEAAAKGEGRSERRAAARIRLGQMALASGNAEEGFRELELASELDPNGPQAHLEIIAGHLRRKENDKALDAVKALEKTQPNNPLTFQMYGLVRMGMRDVAAARQSFEKALEIDPKYFPAAYNLGQLDMIEKRPENARKRFEAMLAKDAANEQIYLALAEVEERSGAGAKEVAATLRRATQANPQSVNSHLALIRWHLRTGDAAAALSAVQAALVALPSDPRVLEAAGVAQEAAGEVGQAVDTYNKLAGLQPQSPKPLYRLAALYVRRGETDKAVESLRRAQKIAPRELDLVPQIAQVYSAAKRYDDALREARAWQKREPKSAAAKSLEGDILFTQGELGDAERVYREALGLDPRADAVAIKLHRVLLSAGKAAEADAWATKWIAANPKEISMRLYLGESALAARNLKASAAQYRAALAIDPDNVMALNNLAWIGGELGDPKALGYAERATKLAPLEPSVLDTHGVLLVKQGNAGAALPFLERARQVAPARYDIRLHYAKALMKAGRKEDARKELSALQAVKGDFPGKSEVPRLLKEL